MRCGLEVEDLLSPPIGLTAEAESLVVKSNPRIPRPLEKIYGDELEAADAVWGSTGRGSLSTRSRGLSPSASWGL